MQKINVNPNFLLDVLHFKNPAVWLAKNILVYDVEAKFWQIRGLRWNT